MVTRQAAAWAPGTWGELVQGTVDGQDILVTCPVNLYVLAVARPDLATPAPPAAPRGEDCGGAPVRAAPVRGRSRLSPGWRGPAGRPRTRAALAGLPGAGQVRLRSPLRPGAGMASSTADLCAAVAAAAAAAGAGDLAPEQLFARCLRLEPTDGLMFPGIALVDHRHGRHARTLGAPPPLSILGVDPGGTVGTAAFNRRPDLAVANRRKEAAVREALDLAIRAVAAGDPAALAVAASCSARAHQAVLPNPLWEQAAALAPACGALGLNVAHSGTVLGFLFDPRRADLPGARAWLERRLNLPVRCLRLVGGGVTAGTREKTPAGLAGLRGWAP